MPKPITAGDIERWTKQALLFDRQGKPKSDHMLQVGLFGALCDGRDYDVEIYRAELIRRGAISKNQEN